MGLESETEEFEVKKAHTRTRSKRKQETKVGDCTADLNSTETTEERTQDHLKKAKGTKKSKKMIPDQETQGIASNLQNQQQNNNRKPEAQVERKKTENAGIVDGAENNKETDGQENKKTTKNQVETNKDVEIQESRRTRLAIKKLANEKSVNLDDTNSLMVDVSKKHKLDSAKDIDTENVKKSKKSKKATKSKLESTQVTSEKVEDADEKDKADGDTKEIAKKPKKLSKRELKKEKAELRETLKREASRLEAARRAINYVSTWKHANSEWKFEKIRQMWLIDNLLDAATVPDDIFPTVIEYFVGCKGMARQQLLKKGMDVVRKQEEQQQRQEEETAPEEETTSKSEVEYKRARQLLQALPTET